MPEDRQAQFYSHSIPRVLGNTVKLVSSVNLYIAELQVFGDCTQARNQQFFDSELVCSNSVEPCVMYDLTSTSTRGQLMFNVNATISPGYHHLSQLIGV